jgi:predicted nucleic acid-binding Zn ribbon protein
MQTPSESQKCVWCGAASPVDAKVCSQCEAVLSGGQPSSDSAPHVVENVTSDAATDPRNNQENPPEAVPALPLKNETIRSARRCAWCGSENPATQTACKDCGAALTESLSSSGSSAPKSDSLPSSTTIDQNLGEILRSLNPVTPFSSGHLRAQLAVSFLVLGILLDVIALVSGYSQIALLLQFLTFVVTGVFFLMWIHRAHRNLPALGAHGLEFSPRWAVGGFFVPFLNIVRPFEVVREIWKASSPDVNVGDASSWQSSTSPLLGFWWGSWIVYNVLMSFRADSLDQLMIASRLNVLSDAVSAICAVLAIMIIRQTDARQEFKIKRLAVPTEPTGQQQGYHGK